MFRMFYTLNPHFFIVSKIIREMGTVFVVSRFILTLLPKGMFCTVNNESFRTEMVWSGQRLGQREALVLARALSWQGLGPGKGSVPAMARSRRRLGPDEGSVPAKARSWRGLGLSEGLVRAKAWSR